MPTLDVMALELATIEFPGLSPEPSLRLLNEMAATVRDRITPGPDHFAFISTLNQYLFEELGFRGNESDYYNPRNSCLNAVLEQRIGIPITLSLVYMELGRRLGMTITGIGAPGHFLIGYGNRVFDPFHGGREVLLENANQMRVSDRLILIRMLNNLLHAYSRVNNFKKTARVLDRLINAEPGHAEYYRARGMAHFQLGHYALAAADWGAYLKIAPDASDHAEIQTQMESARRRLIALN